MTASTLMGHGERTVSSKFLQRKLVREMLTSGMNNLTVTEV